FLVFFEGNGWTQLDNAQKRYIRERIAYKANGRPNYNKVTYDHWFGIHSGFDFNEMMRQAKRAAELGCEYFCLDAGWYGIGAFGASGKGQWDEPDPVKFPNGTADLKRLSDYCRSLGMGFGIWHQVETRNGAGPSMDMATEDGRADALKTLRKWCTEYGLTWMRWEMVGSGGLEYINGYHQVMDTLTREFPDLNIECCSGGGTRFDLGMVQYCTSTWLSDHTANPEVCRFNQTGALRFWPAYFLNLAVRVHRNTGDQEAYAHNLISRMVGAPSFNGDIAQWSPQATARIRKLVDAYKNIRHLQSQPVLFPLPQPRSPRDWDVVVFGDGTGPGQLLYAFRMEGKDKVFVGVPSAPGEWKLVMSSADARIEPAHDGFLLSLPPNSSAVWRR
ncbi:MAG: alpha-galactosidase, partial [Candidatus Omnitrophica bacterium]|nr:alpha-galactosidase [Candidatus Omnitrophota bacterium]